MLRISRSLILVGAFLACTAGGFADTPVPFLGGRVNDTAGMLSSSTVQDLEATLKAHQDSTSNQVVVLTIPSLEDGESIEEFSIRVADTWKIGQKGKDNGVLLVISRDDHKVRIEVGSGLEGALPDITCGSIIRHEIIPPFKTQDFDGGVKAGVNGILAAIRGEYHADEESTSSDMGVMGILFFSVFFLVTVGIFTLVGLVSPGKVGWFLYVFLIPFWGAFPMAVYGAIPGMVLLGSYILFFPIIRLFLPKTAVGKNLGKWAATSSGGSRSGSSGWSSSSSGSSGFSGGGGGFSGGGASGSW
ncbi:MAG: TPM domain-containing protein [Bacteroidota bacterium]